MAVRVYRAIGLLAFAPAYAEEQRPNIVVILADDLGNADLGYRGSDVETPNIDKLAKESVQLPDTSGLRSLRQCRHCIRTAGAKFDTELRG